MLDFDSRLFFIPLQMVVAVYLVVGCGFLFRKKNWFPEQAESPLYKLTVNILMPCLIFATIYKSDLASHYHNLVLAPLIGFATTTIGIGLAFLLAFLPRKLTGLNSWKMIGTFAACIGILNYGFIPIPLVREMYGENSTTFALLFVQNLGVELSLWTVVIIALSGKVDRKAVLRAINGPTCAIVVGVAINLLGWSEYIPKFLVHAIKLLGDASLSISMFMVGLSLAGTLDFSKMLKNWRRSLRIAFWSCFLRLAVLPAFFVSIAVFAPLALEIKRILIIHAAMSSAIFPLVLSKHYDGEPSMAVDVIISNSVLALITSPLWIGIGLTLIKG